MLLEGGGGWKKGMKISCSKMEYLCVSERNSRGKVRLQGAQVKKDSNIQRKRWTGMCKQVGMRGGRFQV